MNVLVLVPHMNVFYGKTEGKEEIRYYENHQFPISAAYISSALKHAQITTVALDLNYYTNPIEKLTETIEDNKIDMVALGGLSRDYWSIKQMIRVVKEQYPNIVIVLGGGIISSEPELIFTDMQVDIGILGEGDITIVEVVRAIENSRSLDDVDGVIFYKDGKPYITKERECIKDIDTIPIPDYEGFELGKYLNYQRCLDLYFLTNPHPRAIQIISSRSCPYQCIFCYHTIASYRQRSLDHLFEEIDYLVSNYDVKVLHICDDLFITSKNNERLVEFCKRIKSYNLNWWCQLRVDSKFDEEIVQLMKDAGCLLIAFGIEHVNSGILKRMNKKITFEQTQRALDICSKVGMGVGGGFILGDFGETKDSIKEVEEWYKKNRPLQLYLSQMIPYPGTQLYKEAVQRGAIKDRLSFIRSGCPAINLTSIADKEYAEIFTNLKDQLYYYAENVAFKSGEDDFRQELHTIILKCAHCGALNVYSDVANAFVNEIYCPKCRTINRRFKNEEHLLFTNFMSWKKYLEEHPEDRVGIVGPSKIIAAMINSLDEKYMKNIKTVFDINPQKAGSQLSAYKVERVPEDLSTLQEKVDVVFIAAQRAYSEIYIAIADVRKYGIRIV